MDVIIAMLIGFGLYLIGLGLSLLIYKMINKQ